MGTLDATVYAVSHVYSCGIHHLAIFTFHCYHIQPCSGSPAQGVPSCRFDKLNINRLKQSRSYFLFLHWNSLGQMEELAIIFSPWLILIQSERTFMSQEEIKRLCSFQVFTVLQQPGDRTSTLDVLLSHQGLLRKRKNRIHLQAAVAVGKLLSEL